MLFVEKLKNLCPCAPKLMKPLTPLLLTRGTSRGRKGAEDRNGALKQEKAMK